MIWSRRLVSIAAVTALLIGMACIWLTHAWIEQRSVLNATEQRLAELVARRAPPEELETITKAISGAREPRTGLLFTHDKEAISRFEDIIRSVARDHGVEVLSFAALVSTLNGDVPAVSAKASFLVADQRMGAFVKSLEDGPPVVFLEHFKVSYSSAPADEGEVSGLEVHATLTVYRDAPERPLP